MRYVAVKVDMVSSRLLQQRGEVQRRFLDIAGEINDRFGEHLVAEFVVTHGDEAQVLLPPSQAHGCSEYASMCPLPWQR